MNISENTGRWPPVYDFEDLKRQIKDLINDGSIFKNFFAFDANEKNFFQGDIISLKKNPVYIDRDGDITILEENYEYWIILGNTCDLFNSPEKTDGAQNSSIPHLSHVSPLIPIPLDAPDKIRDDFKKYKYYKRMFIPNWINGGEDFYIDFTLINSIEKGCLVNHSDVVARLHFKTWVLLNSCLVRYLARYDGRHAS